MNVAICIFEKESKILICLKKNGIWELPGGKIEKNESPEQAMYRELLEELQLTKLNIQFFTKIKNQNDGNDFTLFVYTCKINQEIQSTEHLELRWISPLEIHKYHTYTNTKYIIDLYQKK